MFDDSDKLNHIGKTPYYVTEDRERYFDFVQELLNQVVPRKRSVGNLYNLLEEDGIFTNDFGSNTVGALNLLKEHFHIDNTTNAQWDFTKLMQDYNIPEADYLMWSNRIVDKRTLAGDTLRVEGQVIDNQINPSIIQGDTGLYELYVNVVKRFVDRMIEEEERFIGIGALPHPTTDWIARTGEGASVHGTSMSYCYGCKDSIVEFNNQVVNCQAPTSTQSSTKLTYYKYEDGAFQQRYGKIVTSTNVPASYTGNLNDPACGNNTQYPGLYKWELDANPAYYYPNTSPSSKKNYPQFSGEYWAGVDCSGFVQYGVAAARNIVPGLNLGIPNIPSWISSGQFFTENRVNYRALPEDTPVNLLERNNLLKKLRKGDLIEYDGHITTVYSDRATLVGNQCSYQLIHAFGWECSVNSSFCANNPWFRKVGVTANNHPGLSAPSGFGRIKLWQ